MPVELCSLYIYIYIYNPLAGYKLIAIVSITLPFLFRLITMPNDNDLKIKLAQYALLDALHSHWIEKYYGTSLEVSISFRAV